jgi:hypothetical protein
MPSRQQQRGGWFDGRIGMLEAVRQRQPSPEH